MLWENQKENSQIPLWIYNRYISVFRILLYLSQSETYINMTFAHSQMQFKTNEAAANQTYTSKGHSNWISSHGKKNVQSKATQ